jgi:hypothetical protein
VSNHNVEDLPEAAHELMRQIYFYSSLKSFMDGWDEEYSKTITDYRPIRETTAK